MTISATVQPRSDSMIALDSGTMPTMSPCLESLTLRHVSTPKVPFYCSFNESSLTAPKMFSISKATSLISFESCPVTNAITEALVSF